MTKIPQLYKMRILYSDVGETDLNLQEYFNHKCNQKLDYNKALLGEILGRAPKDFVQHPVAGSPYRQAFSLPEVTFYLSTGNFDKPHLFLHSPIQLLATGK